MSDENTVPTPELLGLPQGNVVYVRTVGVADLDDDIEKPEGVETFYALHDSTGRRLALFDDREFAFAIARQNDLDALSAH